MFSDNFEYDASRSSNPMTIFSQHGYYSTKATNTGGNNPGGYLLHATRYGARLTRARHGIAPDRSSAHGRLVIRPD